MITDGNLDLPNKMKKARNDYTLITKLEMVTFQMKNLLDITMTKWSKLSKPRRQLDTVHFLMWYTKQVTISHTVLIPKVYNLIVIMIKQTNPMVGYSVLYFKD